MPRYQTVNETQSAHSTYRQALREIGASEETKAAAEEVMAIREAEQSDSSTRDS
jgi:hypothetical protein